MKAVVITRPGDPEVLEIHERPIPEPGPSEIRVRIRGSALNRADLLQRRGRYPAPPGSPADIPGLEYVGEVDAVGAEVGLWGVGNRVMGIVGGGAHAEFVCIHEREAIRVPQNLDWAAAAAVPEAFLTAFDAMIRQAGLAEGERVLIHAVGSGVGTAALQLAKAFGASTFGTSRSAWKLERSREAGLDHPVDTSEPGWVDRLEEMLEGRGVDVAVDLLGGNYYEANLRLAGMRGRILVVGTIAGSKAETDLGLLLRKRLRVIGTVLRSRPVEEKIALARDFSEEVIPLLASSRVRPVVDRVMPFEEIVDAHVVMETNETYGKIVLLW